jgi:hypothetical protein
MQDYLRMFAGELGEKILQSFPALHNAHDPVSRRLATLLRKPFPAQTVAAMGVAKKWETDRSAAVGDRRMRNGEDSDLARRFTRS